MWLHHRRAQPAPALPPRRHRLQLRQPRRGEGRRRSAAAYGGAESYGSYAAAIDDPRVDAVVVAVPPRFHLELTLQALAAGKHVLVEKPAFPRMEDYETVVAARNRARAASCSSARTITTSRWRSALRQLLADGVDRRHGLRALHDASRSGSRPPTTGATTRRWPGGDAFFEEGHPLAAPRRQPRPDDHDDPGVSAGRRRARARTAAPRA